MKALILAAGCGKRLRPLTDTVPKCLVKVKGIPILYNTLEKLSEYELSEIGIVVGYKAECIKEAIGNSFKGIPIVYFENERYFETNNIYSLYLARSFFDSDTILCECDVIFPSGMLDSLVNSDKDCSILVSHFDPCIMDGTVVRIIDDRVVELILGSMQEEGFDYSDTKKTVNIYKFSEGFGRAYLALIEWYVSNIDCNCYYEKVLGSMIYLNDFDYYGVEVPQDVWCEVDSINDLKRAEQLICVNA